MIPGSAAYLDGLISVHGSNMLSLQVRNDATIKGAIWIVSGGGGEGTGWAEPGKLGTGGSIGGSGGSGGIQGREGPDEVSISPTLCLDGTNTGLFFSASCPGGDGDSGKTGDAGNPGGNGADGNAGSAGRGSTSGGGGGGTGGPGGLQV